MIVNTANTNAQADPTHPAALAAMVPNQTLNVSFSLFRVIRPPRPVLLDAMWRAGLMTMAAVTGTIAFGALLEKPRSLFLSARTSEEHGNLKRLLYRLSAIRARTSTSSGML